MCERKEEEGRGGGRWLYDWGSIGIRAVELGRETRSEYDAAVGEDLIVLR